MVKILPILMAFLENAGFNDVHTYSVKDLHPAQLLKYRFCIKLERFAYFQIYFKHQQESFSLSECVIPTRPNIYQLDNTHLLGFIANYVF